MRQITFVFATGESWMDSMVTRVTKSRWSHVAIKFDTDDILVEALAGKGLILQSGQKYDEWIPSLFVTKQVSEAAYDKMLSLSRQWAALNIPYGYRTCAAIGVQELFGRYAGQLALDGFVQNRMETLVCSEVLVTLWRIADPSFLPGREARLVSPNEFLQALKAECPICEIDKQ